MTDLSPIDWATRPLKKYADYSGRAPRAEYWWFALLAGVVSLVAILLDRLLGTDKVLGVADVLGNGIIYLVVSLALLIPALAVSVRRLHDTDRSGWWMLLAIIPVVGLVVVVFFLLKGTNDSNRFGPDPYAGEPSRL